MFGRTVSLVEDAMDASGLRHRVISSNIANADTPRFKRSEVSFEEALAEWVERGGKARLSMTDPRHLPGLDFQMPRPLIKRDESTSMRLDGNNVDIEVEMANLAKNTIYYNALATQIYQYFSQLRTAMRDR